MRISFFLKMDLLFKLCALFLNLLIFLPSKLDCVGREQPKQRLPPVILVHGLLGSKLYAQGTNVRYPLGLGGCARRNGSVPFHRAWAGGGLLFWDADCELYRIGLNYNASSRSFANLPGMEVFTNARQEKFGSLDSVQCIDPFCLGEYFRPLVGRLKSLGYREGTSLFSAAYDWRLHTFSPSLDEYYENLKELVEKSVNSTGKRAFLVAHSYGNLIVNHFINTRTSKKWQDRFLNSTVNIAAPFGGSVKTMRELLIGERETAIFHRTVFEAKQVRTFLRSIASPGVLLPRPVAFGRSTRMIVIDHFRTFQLGQIRAFLEFVNSRHLGKIYAENSIRPQRNVPMHCAYGIGIGTPRAYRFKSLEQVRRALEPEETLYGDGDGTVNIESLRMCQRWRESAHRGDKGIEIVEFPGQDHGSILSAKPFFDYLHTLLA